MKSYSLELNSRFRYENIYKELNSLIKNTAKLVNKEKNRYSATSEFSEHIDLLYSHLFEKTNLEQALENLKASKSSINIFELLYKLQKFDKNVLTNKLLELLSEELDKIEEKSEIVYNAIFLLNIEKFNEFFLSNNGKDDLEIYKDILKLFNMERVEFQVLIENYEKLNYVELNKIKKLVGKYNSQNFIESYEKLNKDKIQNINSLLNLFGSIGGEIIKIAVIGRDLNYAINKIFPELELLFGFLSYVRFSFMKGYRWSYDGDYSIDKLDYISFFVLDDNGNIVSPLTDYTIRLTIRDWKNSKLVDLDIDRDPDRFKIYYDFAKEDKSNKNKTKMWENLKEFLRLYHSACSEKNIDYSFLSFWMVSEKILKKINGKTRDQEILRIIEKILKMYYKWPVESFIEKRIKFLYNKRNKLVHEGNFHIISEEDRNLSKLIADCILWFYIDNFPLLNNMNEYKFVLQNLRRSSNEIERYSELLNMIAENKKIKLEK